MNYHEKNEIIHKAETGVLSRKNTLNDKMQYIKSLYINQNASPVK